MLACLTKAAMLHMERKMNLLIKIGYGLLQVSAYFLALLITGVLTCLALWLPSLYLMDDYISPQSVRDIYAVVLVCAGGMTFLAALINFLAYRVWLSLIVMAVITTAFTGAMCKSVFGFGHGYGFGDQTSELLAAGVLWVVFLIAGSIAVYAQHVAWRKLYAACR